VIPLPKIFKVIDSVYPNEERLTVVPEMSHIEHAVSPFSLQIYKWYLKFGQSE
jgi:hypothetical protein